MSTWQFMSSAWSWSPLVTGAGLATLAVYAVVARLRLGARAWFFAAALMVFLLTMMSPIETLAEQYLFTAHMFQHMTLLLIVPALALLARPGSAEAWARGGRDALQEGPAAARRQSKWERALTFPATTWLAGVGAMWVWHAPTLCDAATSSNAVRAVQTVSLLVCGGLFWWPIAGAAGARRLPPLGGVLYLFSACLGCTLLGIIITFSPVAVCSKYLHPVDTMGALPLIREQWGFTPKIDQQVGGLMMWVPSCSIYVSAIMVLLLRWFAGPGAETAAAGKPEPEPSPSHP